jgi:Flp pilus assembly protein TadD
MNWALVGLLALPLISNQVRSQGADQDYIEIYKLIKEADQYRDTGLAEQAATAYAQASNRLRTFQKTNPSWNNRVIDFRLKYIAREMEKLPSASIPAQAAIVQSADAVELVSEVDEQVEAAVAEVTSELGGQVQALNTRIEQLQEENRLYIAKLREAMAAKPAGFNPEELQQAEARIMDLQKEKELLLVKLEQETRSGGAPVDGMQTQLEAAQSTIERQERLIASLKREVTDTSVPSAAPADADRDQLIQELMEQNALLRRQVQESSVKVEAPVSVQTVQKTPTRSSGGSSRRGWWPFSRRNKDTDDRWLHAKLAAYEAERVPYGPEELALMEKKDPSQIGIENMAPAPVAGLNAEQAATAARLEREAQQSAASGDFNTAASRFKSILEMAPDNVHILSNLALIQIQMNTVQDAESTLQRALTLDPNHTFALFLSGLMKINQGDFEGALGYLSQAGRLDPNDAEVQNHLGVVLSELGQRDAGEAALRKAIQLRPSYPDAHINLAVVYASQEPPYKELARYHYQLAQQAGHGKDPRLERLIDGAE